MGKGGEKRRGGRGEGKYTAVPFNPITIDVNFLVAITLT